jgi:hypothetical protein
VFARLSIEQGVHAPAALQPDLDAGMFQRVDGVDDVPGPHRHGFTVVMGSPMR